MTCQRVSGSIHLLRETKSHVPRHLHEYRPMFTVHLYIRRESLSEGYLSLWELVCPSIVTYMISLSSYLYVLSYQAESRVLKEGKDVYWRSSLADSPRTILLGFSKGGVVMNQILSEMSSLETNSADEHEEIGMVPASKESFLKSISEVHYIDVGLNSSGAYITDQNVVQRISQRLTGGGSSVSVFVHGTPRQWRDEQRGWIVKEKDELVRLLKSEGENSGGKLQVHERFYFADRVPDLQMHFEIIDVMDVSSA